MKREICARHFDHPACRARPSCELGREGDDEPALLSELFLLLRGKHHERFSVAELTFFHGHRHVAFPNAGQMFLGECQRRRLIGRHHVEVQQSLGALHPGIEDMYRIGLGMSHREISSFVVHPKNSDTIRLNISQS